MGGLLAALFAGGFLHNETNVMQANSLPEMQDWTQETEPEECQWWSPHQGRRLDVVCTSYALRRMMGAEAIGHAIQRAGDCARRDGTSCVLSHEVGFGVPAALIWSYKEARMQMYLLPTVRMPEGETNTFIRRVALARPPFDTTDADAPRIVRMNQTVEVEHVDVHTHTHRIETLHDEDAYCLQTLLLSVPTECFAGATHVDADERM